MKRASTGFVAFIYALTLAAVAAAQTAPQSPALPSDDLFKLLAPLAGDNTKAVEAAPAPPAPATPAPQTILRFAEPASSPATTDTAPLPAFSLRQPEAGSPAEAPQPALAEPVTLRATLLAEPSLDDAALRQLADAAARFAEDLKNVEHGDRWQAYLRLSQLEQEFGAGATPAVGQASVDRKLAWLKTLHQRYEKLAADPTYQAVTERASFPAARGALGRCLMSPAERQKQLALADGIERLATSLEPTPTGT
ncbi:MAG: hypothetical protein KDA41_16155, partial [Planctomycetales bacterium]|nr:hypothetical protein [Planctomycetales bacterium]